MNSALYRRNPEGTQLGHRILTAAAELYARHGLEWVTFRKLAGEIDSTEASIYRYFHNKYQLLCYLVCRHWQELARDLGQINQAPDGEDRRARLMQKLFPVANGEGFSEHLRALVPIFWLWHQVRTEQDDPYCEPVLQCFADLVEQTALALKGPAENTVQLAFMLCQSGGCLTLYEPLPGFDVLAYRQLWEKFLDAAEGQAIVAQQPEPLAVPAGSNGRGKALMVQEAAAIPEARHEEAAEVEASDQDLAEPVAEIVTSPERSTREYGVVTEITHVLVRKRSGYNLLALRDFMAMPRTEQQHLLTQGHIHFISGAGQPIEMNTALDQLFPAGSTG